MIVSSKHTRKQPLALLGNVTFTKYSITRISPYKLSNTGISSGIVRFCPVSDDLSIRDVKSY